MKRLICFLFIFTSTGVASAALSYVDNANSWEVGGYLNYSSVPNNIVSGYCYPIGPNIIIVTNNRSADKFDIGSSPEEPSFISTVIVENTIIFNATVHMHMYLTVANAESYIQINSNSTVKETIER